MSDLQRRRELAKLTKPQLIDLLLHAERIIAGDAEPASRPDVSAVFVTMKAGMP